MTHDAARRHLELAQASRGRSEMKAQGLAGLAIAAIGWRDFGASDPCVEAASILLVLGAFVVALLLLRSDGFPFVHRDQVFSGEVFAAQVPHQEWEHTRNMAASTWAVAGEAHRANILRAKRLNWAAAALAAGLVLGHAGRAAKAYRGEQAHKPPTVSSVGSAAEQHPPK